jgi:hypothetical protein
MCSSKLRDDKGDGEPGRPGRPCHPATPLADALTNAVDATDWAALIDYTEPPVFDTKLRTADAKATEVITTRAKDFPIVWESLRDSDRRELFWAIGAVHRALVVVARLRPELRAEAERRVSAAGRADPRAFGLAVERVIDEVRRELGSLKE